MTETHELSAAWPPLSPTKERRQYAPIVASVVIVLLALMTISAITRSTSSNTATPVGDQALATPAKAAIGSSSSRADKVRDALGRAGYQFSADANDAVDRVSQSFCALAEKSHTAAEFQGYVVELAIADEESGEMYPIQAVAAVMYYCPEYFELLGA